MPGAGFFAPIVTGRCTIPHPTSGYRLNGKRVPGVTTVIGRFKDSSDLIGWANRMGWEQKDNRTESRRAADAGSAAHDLIERHITNKPRISDDRIAELFNLDGEQLGWMRTAWQSYLIWRKENEIIVDAVEQQLIDPVLEVGGCPDAVGTYNGLRTLFDWKTSGRIYADHVVQCSAYAKMWEREHAEKIEQICLLRVDKKKVLAQSLVMPYDAFERYYDYFVILRHAYRAAGELGCLYSPKPGRKTSLSKYITDWTEDEVSD